MSDAVTIRIEPWDDPLVERHGFPVRSAYAEFCYAGVVGPTPLLLLRRVAAMLEGAKGKPVTVDMVELARSLGVGTGTGRHSNIRRAFGRLEVFDMAVPRPEGYAVRLFVPPLTLRRLRVAPPTVQRIHGRIMARRDSEQSQAG